MKGSQKVLLPSPGTVHFNSLACDFICVAPLTTDIDNSEVCLLTCQSSESPALLSLASCAVCFVAVALVEPLKAPLKTLHEELFLCYDQDDKSIPII